MDEVLKDAPKNWGKWGDQDEVGALNYLTVEEVFRGVRHIKSDMINAAGYKVWPREVEDVLYGHPAVREAAVVGVPDEYRGETVKAYVSLKPGATVTEEELATFCRQQLAAYKYPRSIQLVDDLPKTTTGKILRRELRDWNS